MKCNTKIQAEKIAFHGANKMDAAGYTYEKETGGMVVVLRPLTEEGKFDGLYIVQTDPAVIDLLGNVCTCAFAKENAEYLVCKHSVWANRKLVEEEAAASWDDLAARIDREA